MPEAAAETQTLVNEPLVLRHEAGGVVTLTLNRPKQFNALSEAMLEALIAQLEAVGADPAARVVVLAASGKAFCAGHDLKEMRQTPEQGYYERLFRLCGRMMQTVTRIPQPVIARIHGIATAAGCQLVAQCDLAVAAEEARFATSGINAGLFCSTPAVPLSRNLPRKRAFEMLVTGDFIDAETAAPGGWSTKWCRPRRSTPRWRRWPPRWSASRRWRSPPASAWSMPSWRRG